MRQPRQQFKHEHSSVCPLGSGVEALISVITVLGKPRLEDLEFIASMYYTAGYHLTTSRVWVSRQTKLLLNMNNTKVFHSDKWVLLEAYRNFIPTGKLWGCVGALAGQGLLM